MIFVDKLAVYSNDQLSDINKRYDLFTKWSHLFSDNDEKELHDFALKLGLKKEWFKNIKNFPHYDIVESKRKLAIQLGAREINLRVYLKARQINLHKKLF
ncbi:MAG: DUF4031 domain-containing protein [Candidatus Nanoarchaeia archaeon]|jgi:hypothetical protein|nr:DUF4031 domain-containing protein [Candidatus Nanoarchaeia archaeon]